MPINNQSAAIPYSDSTEYPAGTLGKRIQDLLDEIIEVSVPDGSLNAIKLNAADHAAFRSAIQVVIGTHVQAFNSTLAGLATAGSSANKLAYYTGAGAAALADLTAFARTILDDADQAAVRTTLALTPGTNVQAFHANLAALAGLTLAADKLAYATGAGALALADFPAAGRALAATGSSADLVAGVNRQTGTSYTVVASDRGKILEITNAGAIALTLPATMAADTYLTLIQGGAGQITCASSGSGTVRNRQSHTKTAGQWAGCGLWVRANGGGSAAEWVLTGDTAA